MDLDGVVAIVTGGASGIGRATVCALADRGAICLVADLDDAEGRNVAADAEGIYAHTDVTSEEDVRAAIETANEMGVLRVLVNAAGIGFAGRTVDRHGAPMAMDDFERVVRVNLLGSFNCLRLAAAAMAANEPYGEDGARGSIVNLASIAAFDGQIGQAAYAASKGGIVGMTLPIARDLSAVGVRVNTVAPGLIDTPIYGHGADAERFKEHLAEGVVFPHRLGRAEELASMVVELVTNDYVNGETVRVDGGIRLAPK